MLPLTLVCALAAADPKPADPAARAQALVTALSRGDIPAAVADFDAAMQKAMPADRLKTLWDAVNKQVGPFQKVLSLTSEPHGKFELVLVTCQFEKAALTVRVAVSTDGKVSGLGFQPAKAPEYKAPAYVKAGSFRTTEVTVGAGTPWELPGTVTIPNGNGPFPG